VAVGSAAVFSGMAVCRDARHADDPGLVPVSGPDPRPGRQRQLDCPALRSRRSPFARDRRSASPSGWRPPSGMHLRTEVPVPLRPGRPCRRRKSMCWGTALSTSVL